MSEDGGFFLYGFKNQSVRDYFARVIRTVCK